MRRNSAAGAIPDAGYTFEWRRGDERGVAPSLDSVRCEGSIRSRAPYLDRTCTAHGASLPGGVALDWFRLWRALVDILIQKLRAMVAAELL